MVGDEGGHSMALNWRIFCPIAVFLLSGFLGVGCTKEEKTLDRLIVTTPRIIRAGESVELATWDKNSRRSLDLHDALDVSGSGAKSLNIKSSCDHAYYHGTEKFDFTDLKKPIKIFQFLPPELLSADLTKATMTCSFVLIFANDVGSQHVFHVAATPIQDDNRFGVEISPEEIIRYESATAGKAAVLCPDMTTPALVFQQVTELKYFDFKNFIPREGRTTATLQEKPLQVCRVGVFENEKLIAISKKFEHVVQRDPMSVAVEFHAPSDFDHNYLPAYQQFFQQAVPLRLTTQVFKNTISVTRHLRMQKQSVPAIFEVYAHNVKNVEIAAKHPVATNRIFLVPEDRGGASITDEGTHWKIILNGGDSSFAVTMMASPTGINCSPMGTELFAMLIYPNGPVYLNEVMPSSEDVINSVELKLADKVFLSSGNQPASRSMIENAKTVPAPIYCGWTF